MAGRVVKWDASIDARPEMSGGKSVCASISGVASNDPEAISYTVTFDCVTEAEQARILDLLKSGALTLDDISEYDVVVASERKDAGKDPVFVEISEVSRNYHFSKSQEK